MKLNLSIILIFASTVKAFTQSPDEILLLNKILNLDLINEAMVLNNLTDKSTIRIPDVTNKFENEYFLFYKDSVNFLNVWVCDYYPVDMNTGAYRDIIIYKYEKTDTIDNMIIIFSPFDQCKKQTFTLTLEINHNDGVIELKQKELYSTE